MTEEAKVAPLEERAAAFGIGRAIEHGFEALKRQPAGLLLGAFLLLMTGGGGGGSGGGGDMSGGGDPTAGMSSDEAAIFLVIMAMALVCVLAIMVAVWLFRSWLTVGYFRQHRSIFADGDAPFTQLFSGGDAFGRMALWKLLHGIISLGVMAVCLVPSAAIVGVPYYLDQLHLVYWIVAGVLLVPALVAVAYVELGLVLAERAVALDGCAPLDALELSWDIARGVRLRLFSYLLVLGLFTAVGFVICCIGMVFTLAITDAGITESYLLATGRPTKGL